jgi:hypothetical protein
MVFFNFCKAFAGSGEIGNEVSHPFYTSAVWGGPMYDWLRSILPEHSGISGENWFNTTCS